MLMSRHQNAGQNHNIKVANRSFESVAKFRYLGTAVTGKNFINGEIKNRLNAGNAYCPSFQSLFSFRLLSKNVTIKIRKTAVLPLSLHGCGTSSPALMEGCLETGR
jgi:hypothetical protein